MSRQRVLFARIGWMKFYDGVKPGIDEKPVGGGSYNRTHCGEEVYNFRKRKGQLYGFCRPPRPPYQINLERIDPTAIGSELPNVLLIFVATDPAIDEQRVVGCYRAPRKSPYKVPDKKKRIWYFAITGAKDALLLPVRSHEKGWFAPSGKGAIGRSNVCYMYAADGSKKRMPWAKRIIEQVTSYRGPNQLRISPRK
jgi:hypothetical protein